MKVKKKIADFPKILGAGEKNSLKTMMKRQKREFYGNVLFPKMK
jgi:hypothetical protein